MNAGQNHDDEQRGSAEQAGHKEWSWKPSSGEGSADALCKLKRAERVKSNWRELRLGNGKKPGDRGPSSDK